MTARGTGGGPASRLVTAARLYVAAVMVFAALPTRDVLEATVGQRQSAATLLAHFAEFLVLGVLVVLAAAPGQIGRASCRERV